MTADLPWNWLLGPLLTIVAIIAIAFVLKVMFLPMRSPKRRGFDVILTGQPPVTLRKDNDHG